MRSPLTPGQRGCPIGDRAVMAALLWFVAAAPGASGELIGARTPAERTACGEQGCPPDRKPTHRGPLKNLRARVEEPLDHPNTYQDGLAVHAGGAYAGQFDSLIGHGQKHASGCRDGQCDGRCVVRPERFGFYDTKWRSWPGTMVVQTAGVEELTPARPPRSVRPSVEQESLDPKTGTDFGVGESTDASGEVTLPGLGPSPFPAPAEELPPTPRKAPPAEMPEAAPSEPKEAVPPPKEKAPPPNKPKKESDDENLFDEVARGLRLSERLALANARVIESNPEPIRFPGADDAAPLQRDPQPMPRRATEKEQASDVVGMRPASVQEPVGEKPSGETAAPPRAPANPLRRVSRPERVGGLR